VSRREIQKPTCMQGRVARFLDGVSYRQLRSISWLRGAAPNGLAGSLAAASVKLGYSFDSVSPGVGSDVASVSWRGLSTVVG
jgi:ABC-type uncharacterized transport system permease subunit